MTDIHLVVNEMTVGGQPIHVDFNTSNTGGRDYIAAYNNMFSATGTEGQDSSPGKYFNLVKTGFVHLSLKFSRPLSETIVR